MEVLKDVGGVIRDIIIDRPYYGILLSTLNREINNDISTMCVSLNGLNVQLSINEEFWKKLTRSERKAVTAHEIHHITFDHLDLQNHFENKKAFNIAADVEINQWVDDMEPIVKKDDNQYILPKGALRPSSIGLDDKKYAKKGTKWYYQYIMENQDKKEIQDLMAACDNDCEGDGSKPGSMPGQGTPLGKPMHAHELWDEFANATETEKRVIREQIMTQMSNVWNTLDAVQKQKERGTMPNESKMFLDESLTPKISEVNWNNVMRVFAKGKAVLIDVKKSRRKKNRRFPDFPALKIRPRKKIALATDTSGSVLEPEYIEFMREADAIYRCDVEMTIIECDAYVDEQRGIYEFKGLKSAKYRQVTGGGGTSFDPPIEYINEHPGEFGGLIYLTDGEAPAPKIKSRIPMLWIVTHSGKSIQQMKNEGFPGIIIKMPKDLLK